MAHYVPDSLPAESLSQRPEDYTFEATQLSQPRFPHSQRATQGTQNPNSQVEPRRKYWAVFIPTNAEHSILKLPWSRSRLQIGRGPQAVAGNDVVLAEKRISNKHCRITLGVQGENGATSSLTQDFRDGGDAPDVWIEDLGSSNGTFINGERLKARRLLIHGDEVSLGHAATLDTHDVRYIFRSVGSRGMRAGQSRLGLERVGEVYERYQLLDRLGKGSFAEVRKAVDVETGDLRAIKQIVKHRFAGNLKTLELFHREIDICQRLQHENICRLVEYFEDPQHINLVLEYVDGGDMLDYIMNYPGRQGAGIPESEAAALAYQICSAMAYTHALGVTHRDLKPENILLTKATTESVPIVKIADFGLAKMVTAGTMLKSMVGTPQYLAPEVVMQSKSKPGYENKVDSWSVGIIVYSMMTKALPFEDDNEVPVDQRIRSRYTQPYDSKTLIQVGISHAGLTFVNGLLEKSQEDRFSMSEALEHPWLAGPSSQQTESPPNRLGGDSEWDIESFDGEDAEDNSPDIQQPTWDRPMTASGTNFESEGHIPSDQSFSQPMEALHLTTPSRNLLSNGNPPSPTRTPNGTDAGIKRKPNGGAFSSGSLSPPPVQNVAVNGTGRRQSTRTAERPRKSMRIS